MAKSPSPAETCPSLSDGQPLHFSQDQLDPGVSVIRRAQPADREPVEQEFAL
jgi:hypothetical protein